MQKEIEVTLKFKVSEEDSKSIFIGNTMKYFSNQMLKDIKKGAKEHDVELIDAELIVKET